MLTTYEKFQSLSIDGSLISLEKIDMVTDFFCYPKKYQAIGYEGCIMYCFIEGYDDTVFACNPEGCVGMYIYPLARNFDDFISLIIACGSANPIEQIVWMSKEQFEEHIMSEQVICTKQQEDILLRLQKELEIQPMSNPYENVKNI